MSELTKQQCQACRVDAEILSADKIAQLATEIPEWQIKKHDDILQLERHFKFSNFRKALAFTNRVAEMAEEEGHHPALLTEWGKVTVTWWSHSIQGLHHNDFICAAKTDVLLS